MFSMFIFVSPCPMTIKLDYLSFNAGLVEVMRRNPTQQAHALFWGARGMVCNKLLVCAGFDKDRAFEQAGKRHVTDSDLKLSQGTHL